MRYIKQRRRDRQNAERSQAMAREAAQVLADEKVRLEGVALTRPPLEEIEDLGANGATAARLGNIAHAALIAIRPPVSGTGDGK